MSIDTILYKEQFRLKLGLTSLVFSKVSIITFIVCFIFFDELKFLVAYGMLMILYYKFIFNKTHDGDQMDNIVYNFLSKLNTTMRNKIK